MAWRSGKLNKHLMLMQNWIASSLNAWLHPRLPLGWPCQFIVVASQMSSDPRALSASLYVFQLVVRTSVELVSSRSGYESYAFYAGRARFMQQSLPTTSRSGEIRAPGGPISSRMQSPFLCLTEFPFCLYLAPHAQLRRGWGIFLAAKKRINFAGSANEEPQTAYQTGNGR